ncbi:MAG: secretin N-terminal domain-containing protein [Fuerstiella sp.]|nr:secretin N-terminal domain-containing protein [Fuerstiella sp.]
MSAILLSQRCQVLINAVLTVAGAQPSLVPAQETSAPVASATTAISSEVVLEFSFDGSPWRDVIQWLADSSDLALHVGGLPTGSFTYSDSNSFTPQEAIDRVNLFLLPQGFSLVRSGKLLSVINLTDPQSMQQLNALAKLVTVEQLDQLSDHDVVKCIFPLGELDAEDAVEELNALSLMTPPAVFEKTNQLMITDTAGNLKSVSTILAAFEPHALDNGTVVKSFTLQHADAEDILIVARPHLGLATGEMIGIDVSLSADLQGKNIFVTGIEDKVKLIEGLITAIDQPTKSLTSSGGDAILQTHSVEGGNVQIVYDVLQTLLADETVRLSMDQLGGSVVALASPEIQQEIEQTVAQLQASEAEFSVIPLKTIDPYLAVSLLEEMLDLSDARRREDAGMEAFTRHGNSRGLEIMKSNVSVDVPRIDADPVNRRLFVRARKHQIEQIKKIVAELDSNSSVGSSDQIRILLFRGKQAEQVLVTAAKFWRSPNPIFYYPSPEITEPENTERVVNNDSLKKEPVAMSTPLEASSARLLTKLTNTQTPAIRCQLTPRGLLLQSEDTEALDQFEQHLRTIAGPGDSMPSPPVVFYLKYTRVDDAIRMLAELLDGGEAAVEGDDGDLVNGYVSAASSSFLGSIVTSRDGTMTMMAGSITIVADSRLNRLIVQGTARDVERIETYLAIVDKDSSITSIETYGTSHVVELMYSKASEVAKAVREAYEGRVSGGPKAAGQPGSPQQAATAAAKAEKQKEKEKGDDKADPRKSGGQAPRNLEPKMTIAVHEPSNSLIVTAPEQLFKEVEQLAMQIDLRSKQSVRVITVPDGMEFESLQRFFSGGASVKTSVPSPKKSSSTSKPSSSKSSSRGKSSR